MISCPNCNHQNPEGTVQCEACYTTLPNQADACPECGASVPSDAAFCGQCGFKLNQADSFTESKKLPKTVIIKPSHAAEMSAKEGSNEQYSSESTAQDESLSGCSDSTDRDSFAQPKEPEVADLPLEESSDPHFSKDSRDQVHGASAVPILEKMPERVKAKEAPIIEPTKLQIPIDPATGVTAAATQIQTQKAGLRHVQTNVLLEIPSQLMVIHIGKPNPKIPPDLDLSGFPSSEVVSRIHADLRQEAGIFFIEDTGSANGTYVNHTLLTVGSRHRLRAGDRLSFGKGDKVTFIFQMS